MAKAKPPPPPLRVQWADRNKQKSTANNNKQLTVVTVAPSPLSQQPQPPVLPKRPPPPPLGTYLFDRLQWLRPQTWLHLYQFSTKSPFLPDAQRIDPPAMRRALVAWMLPLVAAWIIQNVVLFVPPHWLPAPRPMELVVPALLGPWSWMCATRAVFKPMMQLQQVAHTYRVLQLPAQPEAYEVLHQRVKSGRAIRYRRFDLYLPPPPRSRTITPMITSKTTAPQRKPNKFPPQEVILLLPGAAVPHCSYANAAAQLSDCGIAVAVVSMEPLRLSQPGLGADWTAISPIMNKVERKLQWYLGGTHNQNCNIAWTLAGHSLGSLAAMQLIHQLYPPESASEDDNSKTNHHRVLQRHLVHPHVVLWGVMYLAAYAAPLKECPVTVLLIQGNCDALVALTAAYKQDFWNDYLPRFSHTVTIDGGTHQGFANYVSAMQEGTEDFALNRPRQQLLAVRETVHFIRHCHRRQRATTKRVGAANPIIKLAHLWRNYPSYRMMLLVCLVLAVRQMVENNNP